MFYSIQGEGFHAGKPSFFIRLAGCNICCSWCDEKIAWSTDVAKMLTIDQIIDHYEIYNSHIVVLTGGEPFLHNLKPLVEFFRARNISVHAETSGVYQINVPIDWITLSPKKHLPPIEENFTKCHELKVIIGNSADLEWAELCASKVYHNNIYLQPEWGKRKTSIPIVIDYIKKNPKWRLSVQMHKLLNIP